MTCSHELHWGCGRTARSWSRGSGQLKQLTRWTLGTRCQCLHARESAGPSQWCGPALDGLIRCVWDQPATSGLNLRVFKNQQDVILVWWSLCSFMSQLTDGHAVGRKQVSTCQNNTWPDHSFHGLSLKRWSRDLCESFTETLVWKHNYCCPKG